MLSVAPVSAQHSTPSSERKEMLACSVERTFLAVAARVDATCDAEGVGEDCWPALGGDLVEAWRGG